MSYLVVAYPKISQDDFNWIQNYRKDNDPRYFSIVKPHFTIVFAVSDLPKDDFVREIKQQAEGLKKFDFEIKISTINQDDSGEYYHEFLVPDKGYSDIVRLHDKFYSGNLAGHLRFDIDFIPHIGIGNADNVQDSKKRVSALNEQMVNIKGKIDTLDIIEYAGGPVKTIEEIILG